MLTQHLRQALRVIVKNPAFSLGVALTLGIGIGANTAIFTVADALLNHPIDFPDQERLISVLERKPKGSGSWSTASPATYLDWRQRSTSFEALAAYAWWDANLTGAGEPTPVKGYRVTPEFFKVLGVEAAPGRVFTPADREAGIERVVVLSHGLWQRLFQGSDRALGSTLQLNGEAYEVLGIMPENFQFPAGGTELWVPLVLDAEDMVNHKARYLSVVGKLEPGKSLEGARAELQAITAKIAEENPDTNRGWGVLVQPLRELVVGEIRPFVLLLTGVVAFVLLIACVNVAILQFARASSRELEVATRAALGSPRWRIVQQLLVESILISVLGGVVALAVGDLGVELIRDNIPAELSKWLPGWQGVGLNWTVFLFTFVISVICGVVCGLAPALQLSRIDLSLSMKGSGHASSLGRAGRQWREALVVAEVVLAVALLVGTGVMVDAFRALVRANQPFEPDRVMAMHMVLPASQYEDLQKAEGFYSRLLARLDALPGVQSVAAVNYMPFAQLNGTTMYSVEGEARASAATQRNANYRSITPAYFATLRIPLKSGRAFSEFDGRDSPRVAIVSQRLATQSWPDQDPLGKRLKTGDPGAEEPWLTVVGVVADVRHSWLDKEIRPTLYVPMAQLPRLRMDVLARTAGDPMALAGNVRRAVAELDRNQPIHSLRTMETAIQEVMVGLRFVVVLMLVASLVALVLATVGIYSVTAYLVRERSKELGIRVALGAAPGQIIKLVIQRGLRLTALGMLIGSLAGIGMAKLLAGLLYGVRIVDGTALAGVLILLTLSALIASYFPARSVAGSDPMIALRHE